jgi:hypothetical protein
MQSNKQSLKPIFAGLAAVLVMIGALSALSMAMPDPAPKADAHHEEGHGNTDHGSTGHETTSSHEGAGEHH